MKWTDQDYLLKDQYKDATNFNARFNLHALFSTNKIGWFPWLFDHLDLPPECRLLELACGTGELWLANLRRIPPGWNITLSDFSPGMLEQARKNLADAPRYFAYERIDIQSIPFEDANFDAVIANHMLYYVPDKSGALSEVRRVLKAGGRFFTSTVGISHLQEMDELVEQFFRRKKFQSNKETNSFTLENGREQLSPFFEEIHLYRYKDNLVVNEAAPLLAYLLSGRVKELLKTRSEDFLQFLAQKIQAQGAIRITKDSGLFWANKRKTGR
jgi:ubiquinone/menaquinone biosynthesis C-methylase UbiE